MKFALMLAVMVWSLPQADSAIAKVGVSPAAQQAGPVSVPRANFIQVMDDEFGRVDTDHDKIITKSELENYRRVAAASSLENARRALFVSLDVDHNGTLSLAEFSRLPMSAPPPAPTLSLEVLDLNRDGTLTLVEFRTAKLSNFDRMDTDKDGVVTPAEMKAAGLIK